MPTTTAEQVDAQSDQSPRAGPQTRSPDTRGFVFLHNKRSGSRDADELFETIARALPDARDQARRFAPGSGETIVSTARRAAETARRLDATLVVVGGDGTVNVAAEQAIAHDIPLGIIAAGTFNFVARSHAIPEPIDAALDLLRNGSSRPVQVGHINSRIFLVNACVGLYRRVLADREVFKHRIGRHRIVAVAAAIWSALQPCDTFSFTASEPLGPARDRASSVLVSNNRLQLHMAGFSEAQVVEHGHLFGVVFGRSTAPWRLWTLLQGALGNLESLPLIRTFTFSRFNMDLPKRRRRTVKVAIDGEITRLELPLRFHAGIGELRLVCPDPAEPESS